MLTAPIVFRMRGDYFAIGAWVLAEVFRMAAPDISALGGGAGQSLTVMAAAAIFIAVIGGIGTIEGVIAGAAVFFALRWFRPTTAQCTGSSSARSPSSSSCSRRRASGASCARAGICSCCRCSVA